MAPTAMKRSASAAGGRGKASPRSKTPAARSPSAAAAKAKAAAAAAKAKALKKAETKVEAKAEDQPQPAAATGCCWARCVRGLPCMADSFANFVLPAAVAATGFHAMCNSDELAKGMYLVPILFALQAAVFLVRAAGCRSILGYNLDEHRMVVTDFAAVHFIWSIYVGTLSQTETYLVDLIPLKRNWFMKQTTWLLDQVTDNRVQALIYAAWAAFAVVYLVLVVDEKSKRSSALRTAALYAACYAGMLLNARADWELREGMSKIVSQKPIKAPTNAQGFSVPP